MRIGQKVKVIGFTDLQCHDTTYGAEDERKYIYSLLNRNGTIESIDQNSLHPITVYFGEDRIPRRQRFCETELKPA